MSGGIGPARRIAFDILLELRGKSKPHSDELLRSEAVEALSDPDKNLATTLVMGVLRWQIELDRRIAATLTRATSKLAAPVEVALEMGIFQLLLLDRIPAHAAIFDSVELTKQSGNAHAAGLVNAVLRKFAGAPKLDTAPRGFSSVQALAAGLAHPDWMVERWARFYGMERASAICRFDQFPPPTTLRLLTPTAEERLAAEGLRLEAGAFVERARRVAGGEITATQSFAAGMVRIQDEGSQLIAELAGRGKAIRIKAILDCCAAPGGKTAILAERNPGVPITACDISPSRLRAMGIFLDKQKNAEDVRLRAIDATKLPFDRQFDLVLCDAPCSGTGTLARNPEIRHRVSAADLARQQARQVQLLTAAMKSLQPGGRLIYSSCSLEPEENEQALDHALHTQAGFRLLPWRPQMEELEANGTLREGTADELFPPGSPEHFLRTIPGVHPCDGFFGALMTRDA